MTSHLSCSEEYDNPIPLVTLKDLPEELKTDREMRIPPVLKRQFETLPFQIGRINVFGNGYCGYYVIQLLEYLNHYNIRSLCDLLTVRSEALQEAKIDEKIKRNLILAKPHYLEYLEVGVILNRLIPKLNIAVIVQSNVKKSGEKRTKRVYPARIVSYKTGHLWSFLLMSNGAKHYELLTILENGLHRSTFTINEAKKILDCCYTKYPDNVVDPSEQLVYLDTEDLLYF